MKVTPLGSVAPPSSRDGVGAPVVWIVKVPASPLVKVVVDALVMTGEVRYVAVMTTSAPVEAVVTDTPVAVASTKLAPAPPAPPEPPAMEQSPSPPPEPPTQPPPPPPPMEPSPSTLS